MSRFLFLVPVILSKFIIIFPAFRAVLKFCRYLLGTCFWAMAYFFPELRFFRSKNSRMLKNGVTFLRLVTRFCNCVLSHRLELERWSLPGISTWWPLLRSVFWLPPLRVVHISFSSSHHNSCGATVHNLYFLYCFPYQSYLFGSVVWDISFTIS